MTGPTDRDTKSDYLVDSGYNALEKMDYRSAENFFRKALSLDQTNYYAFQGLGLVAANNKEYHEALEWFTKAIDANPEYTVAYINRGYSFLALHNENKALEDFQAALYLNPKDTRAMKGVEETTASMAKIPSAGVLESMTPYSIRKNSHSPFGDQKTGTDGYGDSATILQDIASVRQYIDRRAGKDKHLLENLRKEVQPLAGQVVAIKPRSATTMAFVASDGGNGQFSFDPFSFHYVRIADNYGKTFFQDILSPSTDVEELTGKGSPKNPIRRLLNDLELNSIADLAIGFPPKRIQQQHEEIINPSWVTRYRDICEWSVLYERICYHSFSSDTLIVRDGLLRNFGLIFHPKIFKEICLRMETAIEDIYESEKRRIYLVGIAKHSSVLDRYQLALALEKTFPEGDPYYVPIDRELQRKAYKHVAWSKDGLGDHTQKGTYIAGSMFFTRFGSNTYDPLWVVDIFSPQAGQAQEIFGYLMGDAKAGFPVPHYPLCLQRAHEHASVGKLELAILQDQIYLAVKNLLPEENREIVDSWHLRLDVSRRRYV